MGNLIRYGNINLFLEMVDGAAADKEALLESWKENLLRDSKAKRTKRSPKKEPIRTVAVFTSTPINPAILTPFKILICTISHQKYKYLKYLHSCYIYDIVNKMAFNALMGDFYVISA